MLYIVRLVTDQELGMTIDFQACTSCTIRQNKDGAMRMCIDFHTLNATIHVDQHPIPHINNFFTRLHSTHVFLRIDLHAGYH